MRQALAQALHHSAWRSAFGRRLQDQPLMRNVLADLAIESEAATALALRLSRAFDASAEDEAERAFARIGTAVAVLGLQAHAGRRLRIDGMPGGNGYVESILPRLYRGPCQRDLEARNVICLDVARWPGAR
jgi:putative acyl-CoA dehydrogenase